MGLPFCSPFVNVRIGIEKDDYFNLINNLDYYMGQAPEEFPKLKYKDRNWKGWEGRMDFPRLWYDDILIHGFHYSSQREFFEIWEERRKRYNPKNKFIFKILYDEEDVERFEQLDCEQKVGFYHKKTSNENIISVYSDQVSDRYAYQYASYLYDLVRSGEIFTFINIFDLLNGKKNWNKKF